MRWAVGQLYDNLLGGQMKVKLEPQCVGMPRAVVDHRAGVSCSSSDRVCGVRDVMGERESGHLLK